MLISNSRESDFFVELKGASVGRIPILLGLVIFIIICLVYSLRKLFHYEVTPTLPIFQEVHRRAPSSPPMLVLKDTTEPQYRANSVSFHYNLGPVKEKKQSDQSGHSHFATSQSSRSASPISKTGREQSSRLSGWIDSANTAVENGDSDNSGIISFAPDSNGETRDVCSKHSGHDERASETRARKKVVQIMSAPEEINAVGRTWRRKIVEYY